LLTRTNQKVFRVEIKRRVGNQDNLVDGLVWEPEWQDVTSLFVERVSGVSVDLDDQKLEGKFEQTSTTLRFTNELGSFNPQGTVDSLWTDSTGVKTYYMYHSRLRFYEFYEYEESIADGEEIERLPLIDGVLTLEPKYKDGFICEMLVNSKLDMLRDHYILENITSRVKRTSGQSIIQYVKDIFDNYYPELGINSLGGFLRKEIIYDDVTPYSDSLLAMMNTIATDGGGIAGLTRGNDLFFTYFGATIVDKENFQDDSDCIALYSMDATDYDGGTGTSIVDQTGNGNTLSIDNTVDDYWAPGVFGYAANNWYRAETDIFSGLGSYTIEMMVSSKINRLPIKDITYGFTTYKYYPLFVWTYDANDNLGFANETGSGHKFEGFMVDENGDVNYVTGTTAFSFGYGYYISEITNEPIGYTLGEEFISYIAITVDTTEKYLTFYINGKLIQIAYIAELGYVSADSSREKIAGCGFNQMEKSNGATLDFTIKTDDLGVIYYHGMKISDVVKTSSEIFTQYTQLFGSGFALGE